MKTRLESCTWMFTSTGPRPIQINMGPDPIAVPEADKGPDPIHKGPDPNAPQGVRPYRDR